MKINENTIIYVNENSTFRPITNVEKYELLKQAKLEGARELTEKYLIMNKRKGKFCCNRDGLCDKYENDCQKCVINEALAEMEKEQESK